MGLACIDPHSVKEHTEFHKISKFGVNRPNSHLKMSKFYKEMYDLADAARSCSEAFYLSLSDIC